MNQQWDVIVIGGGVVGLTAALAMSARNYSVAVIEAKDFTLSTAKPDPRVYALNYASEDLLRTLNVWSKIDFARLSPYQHMQVWDSVSQGQIEFDSRQVKAPYLGHIVEESVLKEALLQSVGERGITLFPDHPLTAIKPQVDFVQLLAGEVNFQAQLAMIADGGNSRSRQLLNLPIRTWPYHQHALVALVKTEKPHIQTAYQIFNSDGPLAFLPLADKNDCSIVWSTSKAKVDYLLKLSEAEFNEALGVAFEHKLGKVSVQGPRSSFPLIMRHTKQYSGLGWIMLGDAAHTIHPLAGLGLNVGLADLATWLSCLQKESLRSKKALGYYHRQRQSAVWQIIALMDGLKMLFANPFPPIVALRGLGLKLCNELDPLKKKFIEQAAGRKLLLP